MKNFIKDLNEDATELIAKWKIAPFEALQIAVQNQKNEVLAEAFGVQIGHDHTSLEIIAMALGYPHGTIPGDLSSIADSISDLSMAVNSLKPDTE